MSNAGKNGIEQPQQQAVPWQVETQFEPSEFNPDADDFEFEYDSSGNLVKLISYANGILRSIVSIVFFENQFPLL